MPTKNILLLYPKFPDNTFWSFSHALPFAGKKASMPPLGLLTVAAMLPKNYSVKLVDLNTQELQDSDILRADAVFTSSMMVQKDSLQELIHRIKACNKPVVAGGPYPTQYYQQIFGVDHFVLGEAESGVLHAFLRDFERDRARLVYARPVIRAKQGEKEIDEKEYEALKAHFGGDADIQLADARPQMAKSPIPRFDLLNNMGLYASMAVQMSRGCPFSCDFCNEPTLFGHEPRLKSPERMIQEFQTLYDLGFRGSIFIVDDNFIGDRKKLRAILPWLRVFQEERNYPYTLYTEASINLAKDEELMQMMRDAGFHMVFIGIETPDKEVLRQMNKHHNVKTNLLEDVWKIQRHGMEVSAGFIVGNDQDPDDIDEIVFEFCQKAGIPTAMVGLLTALKGSPLYERMRKEGRLVGDSTGDNTHSHGQNFLHLNGRDPKTISRRYHSLLMRLYSGRNYFERCATLFKHLGSRPKSSRRIQWSDIKALCRSLLRQPFTSYGYYYMKFMLGSFCSYPKFFPEAVCAAIFGHHFNRITNQRFIEN